MASVAALKNLQTLDLLQTVVSDAGLEHLKGLKRLRDLNLWNVPTVKGVGLKHLAELQSLERLQLSATRVGDDDLKHLHGLKRLTFLEVKDTQVTTAGVEAVRRELPKCKVGR